jgi:hypothetical protein
MFFNDIRVAHTLRDRGTNLYSFLKYVDIFEIVAGFDHPLDHGFFSLSDPNSWVYVVFHIYRHIY